MDVLGDLPTWSQVSLAGLSLAFNFYIVIAFIRGDIVPRKQLEQVQKMADTWQHGWEVSQANESRLGTIATNLTGMSDVFQHFIESLPKIGGGK